MVSTGKDTQGSTHQSDASVACDTTVYHSKKPHKKSRAGCKGCKVRKIKCDQQRPQCTFCKTRCLPCVYLTGYTDSVSSPAASLQSSGSSRSMSVVPWYQNDLNGKPVAAVILPNLPAWPLPSPTLQLSPTLNSIHGINNMQLRLMHHYSTLTHQSLNVPPQPETASIWQVEMPHLAFEHDFLMDAILAITSLHLEHLQPPSEELKRQTAKYQDRALRGIRKAMMEMSLGNYQAILATSVLIIALAMGQHDMHPEHELWVTSWLSVYKGLSSVIASVTWQNIQQSRLSPLFNQHLQIYGMEPLIPKVLQDMYDSIPKDDQDYPYAETFLRAIQGVGRLYARVATVTLPCPEFELDVGSWPSQLPPDFSMLAKEIRPRALIILAHFLIFFEFTRQSWWIKGIASREISNIRQVLAPEWWPMLKGPMTVLNGGGVATLLANQF